MRSLRTRLLLGSCAVVATGLIISNAVIYSSVRSGAMKEFDKGLLAKARGLSALTEFTDVGLELDFEDSDFAEFSQAEHATYFQLRLDDGTVVKQSEALADRELESIECTRDEPVFRSVILPDQRRGRQVALRFYPKIDDELLSNDGETAEKAGVVATSSQRIDSPVTIVVAESTSYIESLLTRLLWILLLVAGLAIAASTVLISAVVWRALLPLKRIAADIERIDGHALSERIDIGLTPTELSPIVDRINDLLARLELAFQRERSFSSDVAHELRTPLAGLTATIEVCLSRSRDESTYREALNDCLTICQQSRRMIEDLLSISQLESNNVSLTIQPVDLGELLCESWQPFEQAATAKHLQVDWPDAEPIVLATDIEKLRLVIRNLLQNAVSYSNVDGRLRILTSESSNAVTLSVTNTGNMLNSSQASHVFERFWRGDLARTQTGDHFGLGLSLTQKLLEALGGQITVAVSNDLFRADVTLPKSVA